MKRNEEVHAREGEKTVTVILKQMAGELAHGRGDGRNSQKELKQNELIFFSFTAHHLLRPQSYVRIYKYLNTQLQAPWIKRLRTFLIL